MRLTTISTVATRGWSDLVPFNLHQHYTKTVSKGASPDFVCVKVGQTVFVLAAGPPPSPRVRKYESALRRNAPPPPAAAAALAKVIVGECACGMQAAWASC